MTERNKWLLSLGTFRSQIIMYKMYSASTADIYIINNLLDLTIIDQIFLQNLT